MACLRQYLISVGVALALAGCSQQTPEPMAPPPAPAGIEKLPKPAPVPISVRIAPEWQSRVPEIAPAQMDRTLRQAETALNRGQLERGNSPGPGALELYLAVLGIAPDNKQAQVGVRSTLDALLERGRLAMRAGELADAERIDLITRSLFAEHPDLAVYQQYLAQAHQAEALVETATSAARAGHITEPKGSSAADYFQRALAAVPGFDPAVKGMKFWNDDLLKRAWSAARKEDFSAAGSLLMQSQKLLPGSAAARVTSLRVIELRTALTNEALAKGNIAVDKLRLDQADAALAHASKIAAQKSGTDALRLRIHFARHYGPFMPRQVFSEKLSSRVMGPEMVVIPYGRFVMGSSEDEAMHQDNESPAHEVGFQRGFAISRNEITVAEFKNFIDATRYVTTATRAGHSMVYDEKGGVFTEHEGVDWRRDHVGRIASPALPVVHVTAIDAQAYTRWLSARTGHPYRLPSEAEFEYVLRANSTDIYPWGDSPPRLVVGNLPGDGDLSRLGRKWGNAIPNYRDAFWGPAPVRNFPEEPFGTFDMIGNVSEWTLDCWHESYQRAPRDGSAWVNPGCPQRVVRGASWGSALENARSASRTPMDEDSSSARLGFRVVREL